MVEQLTAWVKLQQKVKVRIALEARMQTRYEAVLRCLNQYFSFTEKLFEAFKVAKVALFDHLEGKHFAGFTVAHYYCYIKKKK